MTGSPLSPAPPSGLGHRRVEPELMDDPSLGERDHRRALRALARVHRLSGTGLRIRRVLDQLAGEGAEGRPLRVLDVACGGGDAALDVARWARGSSRTVEVTALDLSPAALRFAEERAQRAGLEVAWLEADALSGLPDGPFDLAISSLFLHHLAEAQVVALLGALRARTGRLHIEDLRRSRLGLALAWGTLRLVSRSRVAHVDGPRSVRAAWSRAELAALAERSGLTGARVRWGWPERWVLDWAAP
ncbi:methyltransferase domain-containing protein [Gaopeijia maritima]|uniref:Methyltransferase domain-containing protein n=1 Tax=Gaopeijia maritima TaxID=3119007 RepID=A0ABU9EA07_9BACT